MKATPALVALIIGALLSLATGLAHALDLGSIGPTYPIGERDLLALITQRLLDKERSGELARLLNEARTRGIQTVRNPAPVAGLRTTQVPRTFYFDPSFTLDRPIFDGQGHLLFPSGTRRNPLEIVSLSRWLLFFDARDRRQVRQARQLMASHQGRIKPILTAGSYMNLMSAWKAPVYYDQHGALTRRLGIGQVPALVSQDGMRLRIDEMEVAP